jgi:23S rRNA pseudouridine2605 synthase
MNKKNSDNKRSSSKPSASRTNSSKSKPALPKRAQNPKKIKSVANTKTTDALKDKAKTNKEPKRLKEKDEIRLNKFISNSGVCSRRDADIYIQSGNVKVNGVVVTEMGYLVKLTDMVNFDGKNLTPEKKEYFLLNKPKNFTTSEEEYNQSRNVFELIKGATQAKIAPVGRMDKNTTGLLLFTNDTDMIRKFGLPKQKSSKIYQVSLDKNLKFEDLEKITSGLTIDNHKITAEEVSYIENEPKSEVGIKLRSSNVKVVRTIFEHLKYNVIKIDRVAFAGLTKKNLPRGTWRVLTDKEIINLKNC